MLYAVRGTRYAVRGVHLVPKLWLGNAYDQAPLSVVVWWGHQAELEGRHSQARAWEREIRVIELLASVGKCWGSLSLTPTYAVDYAQKNELTDSHNVMPHYASFVLSGKSIKSGDVSDLLRARVASSAASPAPVQAQAVIPPPVIHPLAGLTVAGLQEQMLAPKQTVKPQAIKEDDDLLTAIAKLGGLNRDHAKQEGIDTASLNHRAKVFGKSNVFTKNGRDYDDMVESLSGHGDEISGYGFDIKDKNDLVDQVSRAINHGEKIYTPRGSELHAERELSAEQADRFEQEQTKPAREASGSTSQGLDSTENKQSPLNGKHEETAQKLAKQKTDWSGGAFEDNLKSSRELVKKTHKQYANQSITYSPDFAVKDYKVGDEVIFAGDGNNAGFSGIVKKVNRTTMNVESNYFGKPLLLDKVKPTRNATIIRGNDLTFTDQSKYSRMKQERADVGITTDNAVEAVNTLKEFDTQQVASTDEYDDSIPFRRSMAGETKPSGLSVGAVERIANDFMEYYNGNIPLSLLVRNTQEELYGKNATIENEGVIKGAYHANRGGVTLAAANMQGERDTISTLRHEILGHYGLNTFKPQDKRNILWKIIQSKSHKSLQEVWGRIDKLYPDLSELKKAEEVFAAIAESEQGFVGSIRDFVHGWLNRALRAIGLINAPITAPELRNLTRSIAKGIRNGQRTQQTFPTSDEAQFSKDKTLLAPNGKPSNLNAMQWHQVRTTEFKAWFGDWENDYRNSSKVLDENGEPLVVYHGTGKDFSIFENNKEGFHFGAISQASMRSSSDGKNLMPVFLNIRNIQRSKDLSGSWKKTVDSAKIKRNDGIIYLNRYEGISVESVKKAYDADFDMMTVSDKAIKKFAPELEDSYIVFDPNQIKSATGNTGAFSKENDDIRYSQADKPTNAHSKTSLSTALRTQLDKVFGQGWFARLMATGKFVIISRAEAKALGANPNAQAFFNPKDDTTYFVADNIDTRTNLAKLMLHEIGVHALQLGKDNAEFKAILQQVENLTKQPNPSKAVRAAIKAAIDAKTPADLFLEEVAGYLVEHHADLNVSQKIIAWFKKAVRAIGKALPPLERQKFFQWANTLNEADIVTLASAALRNAPDSLLFDGDVRGGIRNSKGQLLAPNGKPSNLNAMQHAQVRTPEFKAWFGDWEQSLQPPVSIIELSGNEIQGSTPAEARKDAKAFIDKLIKTLIEETGTDTLHNERTGFDIRLTQKGVVHGFQHHGAPHVKAVAGIKALIENATKIASMPHEPKIPEWASVHTLVAPLKIGDNFYVVKLTVKEDSKGGFKLYDHQALEMAKPDGIYEPLSSNANTNAEKLGYRPTSGLSISVKQMLTAFNGDNQKYLASKVIDENGEPREMWHGSKESFNEFKNGKSGTRDVSGKNTHGFYFSPLKRVGNNYAGNGVNRSFFLNITNPKIANDYTEIGTLNEGKVNSAISEDYDGYSFTPNEKDLKSGYYGDYNEEYVAFSPNQIKSAAGNTGAFSKDSNDIRYSFAGENAQTADKYQLETAKERLANSENAEQVRKDTGWFKGVDGKFRFEIDDSKSSINQYIADAAFSDKSRLDHFNSGSGVAIYVGLNDILNHDALFSAYPRLNNVSVWFKKSDNINGASFNSYSVTLNTKLDKNGTPLFSKSGLLHELQHFIQSQEGFATGTNIQTASQRADEIRKANAEYHDKVLSKESYQNVVARSNKAYDNGDMAEADRLSPYIKHIEHILSGGEDLAIKVHEAYLSPEEKYIRSAGEIEARNTQARLSLTAEQRRNTPPSQTQDIPDSEAIVVWNGTEMHSATPPANAGNGIRHSFASTANDFFTGKPRRTTTLDDIDTMINTGRQPKDTVGWQWYFDKAVTTFTDSTRPFARFVMDTFDSVQASKLLSGADRALGMKAAYEKEAMNLFGRHIADGIRDIMKHVKPSIKGFVSNAELYKTAKDVTGYWMTAKYSIDANNWLMEKDQTAIDNLNAEIAKTTDPDELKALNKQLAKAKDTQTKRIAAINDPTIIDPTKQKQEAGLAGGFNHATAKAIMAKIEARIPLSLLDKTANYVYDMNQWKLKRDIADGKISQATADKFPKYRHYVPLTGDPRVDDSVEDHFATGSVNQAKDRMLGGRTGSIAQNGIDASFEQLEKSARYHGWNEFKEALTDTYNKLIADKIALGMKQKEAEQAVFDEFDIKRRPEAGMIPAGENDITVRKDGKGFIYTINNQGAMEALRSVNNEDIPSILKPIAAFTRFQARMVTQFMPLFAPTNMIKDVFERSENIRTRKIAGHPDLDMNKVANQAIGHAVKLLAQLKPVMMGVLAENTPLAKLFPVDNANADVIMLKRFLALGGSSIYGDILSGDSKSLAEKLRKTGTFSDKAMEVIELWNNGFETISGFSIYKSLVANGVSDKDAATASLNLMNFKKRGRVMSPLRALYMFANPIAQGGHQLAMTIGTRRGQVRYAVYTIAAMALYAMLRSGDDDDELGANKMDEAGNFNLYRNILIPMGNGQYFKVPVGFGMQQLAWSSGVNAARTLWGEMTIGEAMAEEAGLWARSAMPVAPAETAMLKNPMVWFAQTFSPQVAKPIVNIAMDVNSFGAPLTNARYERQDKAKALQGRRETPSIYKEIAQEFARHGMDFYPEQAREFMRDYMAGVGNEALKWAVENPAKTARGLDVSSPLIDRYVLQTNDDSLRQRLYYRARDRMNELEIRKSTGDILTPKEEQLVGLGDKLKTLESRTRGKAASATKAEKLGQDVKAKNLRAQAERGREDYINYALTNIKRMAVS